eukprot:m.197898 g.197898  ORF g.197898 m.197898 type:complete len:736 (+) comp17031_c0_seq3:1440-3647(+)
MASKRSGIHIKPYKGKTSDKFNVKTWEIVEKAMYQIKNQESSSLLFEELYRSVYQLCLDKQEVKVYNKLKGVVQAMAATTAAQLERLSDGNLLEPLINEYQLHFVLMNKIKDVFLYLDNMYCSKKNIALTFTLGLAVFRDDVILREKINLRLHAQLLHNFQLDRAGSIIDRTLLRASAAMLIALGPSPEPYSLYAKHMESLFLTQAREHYVQAAITQLEHTTFEGYLQFVHQAMASEVERVEACLDTMTVPAMLKMLRHELLYCQLNTIFQLSNGIEALFAERNCQVFKLAYTLFSTDDEMLTRLRTEFQQLLQSLVEAACNPNDDSDGIKTIQTLLDIKEGAMRILSQGCRNDSAFQRSVAVAFETGMTSNRNCPEFLCSYMDDKLRRGVKELSDLQVEECLSNAVGLFRHLEDKDMFEKHYKFFLSKRLLLNKSASDDAERSLLAKLKVECGHTFTSKMEGMFRDIGLSHAIVAKFKQFESMGGQQTSHRLDFSVQILNPACWPKLAETPSCTFPTELQQARDRFEAFYHKQHNGRKLIWQPTKGTGEIVAKYTKRQHIFVMSTSCLVVLLQFNNYSTDDLSFSDLQELTSLHDGDLKRTLQSLACGKHKILTKSSDSKQIAHDDRFSINSSYSNKMIRVKVQQVAAKVKEERAATTAKVKEERKLEIEAAVVRVMKARKTLSHTHLVIEVTKVLAARFKPNPVHIKKRIESLIDRDYLKRDEKDRTCYHYVA